MEFKMITLDSFLDVERRHGINLISDDIREEYSEAHKKMSNFYVTTYAPFIQIYKKKKTPSEAQVQKFRQLTSEFTELRVIFEREKVMYYFQLMKLFIDDLDVTVLDNETVLKFGEHFEDCTKRYFVPKVSSADEDEDEKKKEKESSGFTFFAKSKVFRKLKSLVRLSD